MQREKLSIVCIVEIHKFMQRSGQLPKLCGQLCPLYFCLTELKIQSNIFAKKRLFPNKILTCQSEYTSRFKRLSLLYLSMRVQISFFLNVLSNYFLIPQLNAIREIE